jgi:hypothetical protein
VKSFSMFEEARKIAISSQVQDMGHVHNISRRDYDERETFRFRAKAPCLEYLSLLIENALLLRTNRMGRVYVGFEKLSRLEPVADRYMRIADVSERVYVFGEEDWRPPRHPNIKIITLGADYKLARELFVIADSSTLRAALIAWDEDGLDVPVLEARNFRAFKSTDPAIVRQLAAAAEGLIDHSIAA